MKVYNVVDIHFHLSVFPKRKNYGNISQQRNKIYRGGREKCSQLL